MINVAELARRLSTAVGRPTGANSGSRLRADDVLAYFRAHGAAAQAAFELEHGASVVRDLDRVIATLPRLIAEQRLVRRHPGFVRYFEALPRIAFMTARGYSSDEIATSMNFLATEFGVDAVLRIAAGAIAKRVVGG